MLFSLRFSTYVLDMSLQPILRKKVEELYFRWITDPNTQSILRENLQQICNGESAASILASCPPRQNLSPSFLSPRVQVGPQVPQSPNKTVSPRSPRRSLNGKHRIDGKENLTPRSQTSGETPTSSSNSKPYDDSPIDAESHNSSKIHSRRSRSAKARKASVTVENIPAFYFPRGRPKTKEQIDTEMRKIVTVFDKLGNEMRKGDMHKLTEILKVPLYWKQPLFNAADGSESRPVTKESFKALWSKISSNYHDDASKFIALLTKCQRNELCQDDFLMFVQDIVDSHPGLSFLHDSPEFHSRYVHTVISRIFFTVNSSWSGRISASELRKSNFLQVIASLQETEDINLITDYFSYEHFYVIYCKFWELDADHDLYISKEDLSRHNNYAVSSRMIDRIFSGAVSRGRPSARMSYPEFVWFLIAEEDKLNPRSVEYWFRCLDIDGDGVLSMFELEFFYEEQLERMTLHGIQDQISFEDCMCQMLDLVKPKTPNMIRLSDLKRCKLANVFFDTFFNLSKFMEREQRDPFLNLRDLEEDRPMSDWEKFAAETYDLLVAEENPYDDYFYKDDFEPDDEPHGLSLSDGHDQNNLLKAMGLEVGRRATGTNADAFGSRY